MTVRPPVDASALLAVVLLTAGGALLLVGVWLILPAAVLVVIGAVLLWLAWRLP